MSKLLIVDDNEENLALLRVLLAGEGFDIITARDGVACLQRAVEDAPDAILLDIMMPGMDGIEVCRHLKRNEATIPIPVVMVSAHGEDERVVAALDAGAHDYVTKPVNRRIVGARVRSALRIKEALDETALLLCQLEAGNAELEEMSERFKRLSLVDSLTGVGNRRAMEISLDQLHSAAGRFGRVYSLGLFDVDHFKKYNDRYGHLAGDHVLREVASAMVGTLRGADRVFRYGGEEFLLIFDETDERGAEIVCERLRETIEQLAFEHVDSEHEKITVSCGVAAQTDGAAVADSWRPLVEVADAALYRAKEQGRNRVLIAGS